MSSETQTIDTAVDQFKTGKIDITQLQQIVQENGAAFSFWNRELEPFPAYPKGDNRSRGPSLWDPSLSLPGRFFQGVIKKAILKAIDFAHSSITQHYDQDGYNYDDPRLQKLNSVFQGYIKQNFHHSYPYKSDFMHKVIDIILFLMKEDAYYRARFLDLLDRLPKGKEIELTENEKENIERWH